MDKKKPIRKQKNMIDWINNYIDRKKKEGRKFIDKIN